MSPVHVLCAPATSHCDWRLHCCILYTKAILTALSSKSCDLASHGSWSEEVLVLYAGSCSQGTSTKLCGHSQSPAGLRSNLVKDDADLDASRRVRTRNRNSMCRFRDEAFLPIDLHQNCRLQHKLLSLAVDHSYTVLSSPELARHDGCHLYGIEPFRRVEMRCRTDICERACSAVFTRSSAFDCIVATRTVTHVWTLQRHLLRPFWQRARHHCATSRSKTSRMRKH